MVELDEGSVEFDDKDGHDIEIENLDDEDDDDEIILFVEYKYCTICHIE